MRILLQFPEGLKYKALEYSEKYQKEGHEVFISSTPCFGACGVAIQEAQMVNADKIIHFGHSKFVKKDLPVPVEYINYEINIDVNYLEHIMEELEPYTSLGLVTTIQHVHQLEEIKEFLQSKGKTVLIGKGNIASEEGQVLGCDAGAITTILDQIDAVLYVGGGLFHPTAIKITKPVFVYNPHSHSIEDISPKIEKIAFIDNSIHS